ncbi:MAG TPA: acetyl-CoA carboxylase biotin carboxyl carrier protein [bacterium]|nr:acetyl-CoA carboxylase biotin carboxyl carrier protein [bacterium]
MDYNLIKRIVALVERSDIHELEVEDEEVRIKVSKVTPVLEAAPRLYAQDIGAITHMTPTPSLPTTHRGLQAATGQELSVPEESSQRNTITINSPMVGTFYRAPAPEAPPFVKIGDSVDPDTVVCILEAMKVMNEIKAEVRGRITEVLVENAQPVEFGQALFRVEPN